MADSEQVKAALAALADGETADPNAEYGDTTTAQWTSERAGEGVVEYRVTIERAVEATDDIEAAAEFVESVGLDELEAAVERAEHEVSGLAADGREALATFEQFRVAARGPRGD